MNSSDMKNIVVLKNLPSNMVEEAIVILKENKKVKKYQYVDKNNDVQNVNKENENRKKTGDIQKHETYILKEAEMVIKNYISQLEMNSPKWKNDMKKLEIRYKKSLKVNFFLGFVAIIGFIMSFI